MTSIENTHALNGLDAAIPSVHANGRPARVELSQSEIDRGVRAGRRLRAQAYARAVSGLGGWLFSIGRTALGRRATNKLGCGECGAMMGA